MFIDARTLDSGQKLEADICIIGAGAAGITIAREFIGHSTRVALVESGGLMLDGLTQSLADGENTGLPYFPLIGTRLRFFGGTTNHWSGFCRPLDAIDFEARPEIPHSGWPLTRDQLSPFYNRAHDVLQLGPFDYTVASFESDKARAVPLPGSRVQNAMFLHQPTRFLGTYKDAIEKAANVTAYLNANVTSVGTNEAADHATQLQLACLPDLRRLTLTARIFIVAVGAVENARLLLLSNQRQPAGLGNQHDLVGRYFAEHPHFESGLWLPAPALENLPLYESHWSSKPVPFAAFALTEETLRREKLQNIGIALTPLGRDARKPDKYVKREVPDDAPRETLENLYRIGLSPGVQPDAPRFFGLYHRMEQAPNPDSRVTLGDKLDALGQPKSRLAWKLSPQDRASLRRTLEIFSAEIGRLGLGHVRIDLAPGDDTWPKVPEGGFHHMGTTRMHADPKQGVVDPSCRVHGIDNLYVAGSSVFPTYGYANPTLTLVALALRLADHIKESKA